MTADASSATPCSAAPGRCPASVSHSPRACRIVKWASAAGYLSAYGLIYRTTGIAVERGMAEELGVWLLLRISLITILFTVTMWSMNHLIACARRGEKGHPR